MQRYDKWPRPGAGDLLDPDRRMAEGLRASMTDARRRPFAETVVPALRAHEV